MDYDEELSRVLSTANAAKNTLPDVLVAAPSTCAWWFYWTSEVGYSDNAAHDNIDFLPWFLAQMKTAETTYGKRLLDYLGTPPLTTTVADIINAFLQTSTTTLQPTSAAPTRPPKPSSCA